MHLKENSLSPTGNFLYSEAFWNIFSNTPKNALLLSDTK